VGGGPTSISDNDRYRAACARAAANDADFARFRRDAAFLEIVEPPSRARDAGRPDSAIDGAEYAAAVRANEAYRPLLDAFRRNDAIGDPVVEEFDGLGAFNIYTLRYIKILGDLERLFGSLDGRRILEIGGGYGGQGAIIARRFAIAAYDILDLPEPGALARRFLAAAGVAPARCVADLADLAPHYDLMISNYALSELEDGLRTRYLAELPPRCAHGFMLWNRLGLDVAQFGRSQAEAAAAFRDEMLPLFKRLPNPRIVPELLTADDARRANVIVAWG
jgi:hypothetical protein